MPAERLKFHFRYGIVKARMYVCACAGIGRCRHGKEVVQSMVFVNEEFDSASGIIVCGYYKPYGKWRNDPETADAPYDLYSGKILDLKEGKSGAVNYFYSLLDDEICPGVAIAVVPSHSPENKGGGLKALAKKLAAHDRIDMTECLIRTKEIEKLSRGGNRDKGVHLDSIAVNPDVPVADEVVLVVDDVTTSGNSLYACRDILLAHGAKRVALLALGQTTH